MAKVTGFINAVLSGKLGGTVYANNKGGSYVRQYIKPTNPNTIAQISARADFTSAISAWHALTDAEKALWNSYALNHYASKLGSTGATYSGFNAFCALQNTARNANRMSRAVAWTSGVSSLTVSQTGFAPTATPPTNDFSSNVQTSGGVTVPLSLNSVSFDTDSTASITFGFLTPQAVAPVFQDAIGNVPVGYNVYISNALSQNQQFVQNRFLELLGSIKAPTITSGWPASPASSITASFSSTSDFDIPARKNWYGVGEVVEVSVYAVGVSGAMKLIGSQKATAT